MTRFVRFALPVFLLPILLTASEPAIRVRLISRLDRIVMVPQDMWQVRDVAATLLIPEKPITLRVEGKKVVLESNGATLMVDSVITLESPEPNGAMLIRNVPFGIGWAWQGREDRTYEGTLDIRVTSDGKLSVVNILPLEDYLGGVIPYEIGEESPFEALKAQAVAARSEAIVALRTAQYSGPGYDICSDVECQVYGGIARRTPAIRRAIRETRSLVLWGNGQPIGAYFSSTCGGVLENVENVWPERSGPKSYWSTHADGDSTPAKSLADEATLREWLAGNPPCNCNPYLHRQLPDVTWKSWRWTVVTPAESLTAWVNKRASIGRVLAIDSITRGPSGRILTARFVGERGSYKVKDQLAFRQLWNPDLRSSCVVVDALGPADRPYVFRLTGAGWGHGVGMCQSGAMGMALEGKNFREILSHYFPTASVQPGYADE